MIEFFIDNLNRIAKGEQKHNEINFIINTNASNNIAIFIYNDCYYEILRTRFCSDEENCGFYIHIHNDSSTNIYHYNIKMITRDRLHDNDINRSVSNTFLFNFLLNLPKVKSQPINSDLKYKKSSIKKKS